jgi:hypothetical protein
MEARRKKFIGIFAIFGIAFTASAMAAEVTTNAQYKQDLSAAELNYESQHGACDIASKSERLACRRQALAALDTAEADAREAHGLPRHAQGPRF